MAENLLSKIVLNGESYDIKDADARDRLATLEGASKVSSFNGRTGAVVPAAGDYSYDMISNIPSLATASVAGLMSATDKAKLDSISSTITAIFDENGIYFGDTTNSFSDYTCFIN